MKRAGISVLIVSYNDREIMCRCLAALHAQLSSPLDEVIVVDNGSTDGVLEDLRSDDRIRLIENGENAGFPVGCNIGFAAARPGNDIFLLNNDAILADGAMERLLEALYSADDVGAAGPVSNNALEQIEPGAPGELEAALAFGRALSSGETRFTDEAHSSEGTLYSEEVPFSEGTLYAEEVHYFGGAISSGGVSAGAYEYRPRLTGFAVLIRRTVADALFEADGFLMDPRFSPGYFEDEDLGVRIALAGYRQILCHSAFVYHKGGTGFASHPEAMTLGRRRFEDKWGFDIWAYIGVLEDYEAAAARYLGGGGICVTPDAEIHVTSDAEIRVTPDAGTGVRQSAGTCVRQDAGAGVRQSSEAGVKMDTDPCAAPCGLRILEIGCGMGVNSAHLVYLYPGSTAVGIEPDPLVAQIAAQLIDVICEDPEEALLAAEKPGTPEARVLVAGTFDLIFAWDACERSDDPEGMRARLEKLLKPAGLMVQGFI